MFIATIDGNAVWASSARRANSHTCPGCGSEVRLKAQNSAFMQAHFAHVANSSCGGLGVESDEHFALKYWYVAQLEAMGASDISYEKRVYIHDAKWRQPDIAFTWKGRRYAIEVQRSKISDEKILERTNDLMMAGIDRALWVIHDKWADTVTSKTRLHVGGTFNVDRKSITAPFPLDMMAMPRPCFWDFSDVHAKDIGGRHTLRLCGYPRPDFSRARTEKILKLQLVSKVSSNGNMVCHATVTTPSVRFTSYLTYEYNGVAIDRLNCIVEHEQAIELGRGRWPGRPVTPSGTRTVTFAQKGDWWRIYDIDKPLPPEPPTTMSPVCASGTKQGALGGVCVGSCAWKCSNTWVMIFSGAET